jgi:molybdopterin/thiamine biosynthesis adenylyltransferase
LTIVGAGGLGSPLALHSALLGVGKVFVIDSEELDDTNRNRFMLARHDDPVPGSPKVDLIARMINEINPHVEVVPLNCGLVNIESFNAIKQSDWVAGCFDSDGPRSILNELCAAYDKPYLDLASDVPESGIYGGRIFFSSKENGCLSCMGLLDQDEVANYLIAEEEKNNRAKVYGVSREVLDEKGPSVSPINGVVASLAATELMVGITGLRKPTRFIEYRGHLSKVLVNNDPQEESCYICSSVRGLRSEADVERFLRIPHLRE